MQDNTIYNFIFYQENFIANESGDMPIIPNRGLCYGDSFFETIRYEHGRAAHLDLHISRIMAACEALKLNLHPFLNKIIADLDRVRAVVCMGHDAPVLVRVQIWRAGAGLYLPLTNDLEWCISARPAADTHLQNTILQMQIARSVHTQYSRFSAFKTGAGSLIYVLAALERQQIGADCLLLTNPDGHISEADTGNIFWIDGMDKLCTPSLQTGCISGIRREVLMRAARDLGMVCLETTALVGELDEAKAIFVSNVSSLRAVARLANKAFDAPFCHSIIKKLSGK